MELTSYPPVFFADIKEYTITPMILTQKNKILLHYYLQILLKCQKAFPLQIDILLKPGYVF
jgi:hypothetical protein